MYNSEPRVILTLITHANKVFELEWEPLGPIGVLAPSDSNSEVDSTSHYQELAKLQYHMHITMAHYVLGL